MSNENFESILNLKNEIEKYAPPIQHTSSDEKYGKATDNYYGHVKLESVLNNSNNPVTGAAIMNYINYPLNYINIETNSINDAHTTNNKYNLPTSKAVLNKISEIETTLRNTLQPKINISEHILSDAGNDTIPTSKAVLDIVSDSQDLTGKILSQPSEYQGDINNLLTPGYYIIKPNINNASFDYGGEKIPYTNALVTVQQQSNRIIQHVCATSKVINDNNEYVYKINGTEYTRYGIYTNDTTEWKSWHLLHKPYTKTSRVNELGTNIDDNAINIYENTSGFIIKWTQSDSQDNRYTIDAPLYNYADICTFAPALPIDGPYVFSNLIARMDVKITPTKMQIRSNISPGGYIANIDETYFVPRNQ